MSWDIVKIGSLCKVGRGSSPRPINDDIYFTGGTIPWIKIADATSSTRKIFESKQHVNEYGASFSRLLPEGSLIIAASGTLGLPMFLGVEGCIHDGWLYVDDLDDRLNKEFLYYKLIELNKYFYSKAYGAAIQNINTGILRETQVKLPPLPTQRRIASILSAYDDLIENNLKRIKLLEEAAQNIYREWFVEMRFPSHEEAEWYTDEEGRRLPVGWECHKFSDVVEINPRTKVEKDHLAPYVPMGSLSETSMIIEPLEARVPKGGARFKNGDTLFARITPCLENGKTGFVQCLGEDVVATGSTEFIVFRPTESLGRYFIYLTARTYDFRQNAIKSMTGSDGRQRVKPDAFQAYLLSVPPSKLMDSFESLLKPFFLQIQQCVVTNRKLKEARDILLPRLMNQTIEV